MGGEIWTKLTQMHLRSLKNVCSAVVSCFSEVGIPWQWSVNSLHFICQAYMKKTTQKPPLKPTPKLNSILVSCFTSNTLLGFKLQLGFVIINLWIWQFLDIYLIWTVSGIAHSNSLKPAKALNPIKIGLLEIPSFNQITQNSVNPIRLCFIRCFLS